VRSRGNAVDVRAGGIQVCGFVDIGLVGEAVDQLDHARAHGAARFDAHSEVVDVSRVAKLRVLVGKVVLQILGGCCGRTLCGVLAPWLYHGGVNGNQIAFSSANEHVHTALGVALLIYIPRDFCVDNVSTVAGQIGQDLNHVVVTARVPPCACTIQ
jgi:hypothetical protein